MLETFPVLKSVGVDLRVGESQAMMSSGWPSHLYESSSEVIGQCLMFCVCNRRGSETRHVMVRFAWLEQIETSQESVLTTRLPFQLTISSHQTTLRW